MRCKLSDRLWEKSYAWERAHANDGELWSEDTARNRDLMEQAWAIRDTDPAAAFQLSLEAAEAGSAIALETVAWHYEAGAGVAADPDEAREYYRRAICAGSWMATLRYASLLAQQGHHDLCERVLEDGVASDFVPASFWLAWHRYKRCKSRNVRREIRPMLEHAAGKRHPAAQLMLARLMVFGKLGLREIPAGLILVLRYAFGPALEDVDSDTAAGARERT